MQNNTGKIDFSFSKKERLSSKKLFEKLFSEGSSFLAYPVKIIFTEAGHQGNYPVQAAFAVSKRIFKKAVSRTLLKRRMREAYRLNKHNLYRNLGDKKLILILIYVGKEIEDYHRIENSIKRLIDLAEKKLA